MCQNHCSTGLGTLGGTLFSSGRADEVSVCSIPPPFLAGSCAQLQHHDIGEELEWRPPLLSANPLDRRVVATLEVCQKCVK